MEPRRFDDLARRAARPTSRRRLLGAVAGGVMAAALGRSQAGAKGDRGNSPCAHFCTEVFPPGPARGACISDAAHGTGLCIECGADTTRICGGTCCDPGVQCDDGSCQDQACDVTTCTGPGTCPNDWACINGGCFAPAVQLSCPDGCGDGTCTAAGQFLSGDITLYCVNLSAAIETGCLLSQSGEGGCPDGHLCTPATSSEGIPNFGLCVPPCSYPV